MSHRGRVAQFVWITALLAGVCAAPALGDVIIYTYDSTVDSPTGPFVVALKPGSFSLPQYNDPAPLIFVTIEVTGVTMGGINTWDNETDAAGWAEVTLGAEIHVTSNTPAAPMVTLVIPQATANQNIEGDDPLEAGAPVWFLGQWTNADYVGGDSVSVTTAGESDSDSDILGPGDDLTPFIGTGTVQWNFVSYLIATHRSNNPVGQGQEEPPQFNFTARVIYENTAPEPAALAVLCLGMAPILARRRARR
ncbi:MAG TPA: choice-of-anchor E domain-containing protein [Phycisphaerae bacterium]|nr:choice-of-anchor E domain-containing protein [Phycisphaerae bacterium]